ncbi:hypothetical protein FBU30_000287, partial [Linnemannia zychae]
MIPGLKEYFENSAARDISLVSFMRRFKDLHEKDRIIRIWYGALSILQKHSSSEKRQLYSTLHKYSQLELEKIVDKELQEREHDHALLTNASRQELAASRLHTKQVEERFDAAMTSTTTSTVTSMATGSIQSIERSPADEMQFQSTASPPHYPVPKTSEISTTNNPNRSLSEISAEERDTELTCVLGAAGVVESNEDVVDNEDEDETEDEPEPGDVDGGSADNSEEDSFSDQEVLRLLANISKAQHPACTWKFGDTCIACLFQQYQRACVQALQDNELRKADIADVMAIIGIFAPFLPTDRMRRTFEPRILGQLIRSPDLPDPSIDDAAIVKAVRRFESLPDEMDRSVSEVTFTVNYVAPVLNSILRIKGKTDVQYPNTESSVQKLQGLKPDRPDILVKAYGNEIMYGEITGPCRVTCKAKANWDLFRLARFGKTYLDKGNDLVPLLQVVHDSGLAMKLTFQTRGVYLLER